MKVLFVINLLLKMIPLCFYFTITRDFEWINLNDYTEATMVMMLGKFLLQVCTYCSKKVHFPKSWSNSFWNYNCQVLELKKKNNFIIYIIVMIYILYICPCYNLKTQLQRSIAMNFHRPCKTIMHQNKEMWGLGKIFIEHQFI